MSYLHSKHFTVQQAQTAIKKVKSMAQELVELKKKLHDRGFDIYRHQFFGGSGPNGEQFFPPELERLVEILKQLEHRGVIVKGIDQGLLDFPHIRSNGEEVYLCFKAGEDEIRFWHSLEGGFAGRQPLTKL